MRPDRRLFQVKFSYMVASELQPGVTKTQFYRAYRTYWVVAPTPSRAMEVIRRRFAFDGERDTEIDIYTVRQKSHPDFILIEGE